MKSGHFINLPVAKHKILIWILAFSITAGFAIYQRMTGPTYPVNGETTVGDSRVSFKLLTSKTVGRDAPVILHAPDSSITGYLSYRRYKSHDEWTRMELQRNGQNLRAHLPAQPPAGKIMYKVFLTKNGNTKSLTGDEPVMLRYKGAVPAAILIPHVVLMFLAMLFSNRAALEALDPNGQFRKYMLWTIGFFLAGGFILGPLVQKFAFGELWTGIPFGYDLTDNKTLIAMLGWLLAWRKNRKGQQNRVWIIIAAILMLAVYLIPHSVLGSELDYTETNMAASM